MPAVGEFDFSGGAGIVPGTQTKQGATLAEILRALVDDIALMQVTATTENVGDATTESVGTDISETAGGTYTSNEQDMLTALKAAVNQDHLLLAELKAGYDQNVALLTEIKTQVDAQAGQSVSVEKA